MLKNYLITSLRNLSKNKIFTIINISGLSVGMASVLLIILFIKDELSFDKFHDHSEDIYRIAWFSGDPQTRTPHPMALAMVRDFPEVEKGVSLSPIWGPGLTAQTLSVSNPETLLRFDETNILAVDSNFFDVFSFEVVLGDENALNKPNTILISEKMAKKYFADSNPIGKMLNIKFRSSEVAISVAGVFANVPDNSHFHIDFLISYVGLKGRRPGSEYYTWRDFGHFNYVKLKHGADPQVLQDKLMEWSANYMDWLTPEVLEEAEMNNYHFKLQPITDIHLKSQIRWELEPNGNIAYIHIMTASALFILIIACVNFMNITSSKSIERTKEIGIRKSVGATRPQLIMQFLGESITIAIISMILAGLLLEIFSPFFNQITGKNLQINYLLDYQLLIFMFALALLVGIYSVN